MGELMTYAFTQDVPIDEAMYRKIMTEIGPEPLEGSLLHLCLRRPDGSLSYVDIWESEQACARAFEERIHPAVDRAFGGSRPGTESTVNRVEVLDVLGSWRPETVH